MAGPDRGPALYAYYPIPANPMSVALLILLAIVTLLIGPIVAAPAGLWPVGGLCFLPLALVVLWMLAFKPSPTYIYENGIEISLPLWRRLAPTPRYIAWDEVSDVYPASYEVAGSFMSPFASSAGTLVHAGIALETRQGRRHLLRFTPGSIRAFRAESRGFSEALEAIRERFDRHGQPMVTTARSFSDAEILALQARAHEPLISIATVFLAFFLPPAIVAATFLAASAFSLQIAASLAALAIGIALIPPAVAMILTLRRSERRNRILSELWKHQERLRADAARTDASPGT